MHNRKIYILLTKFSGRTARLVDFITAYHYNHVSIGLEEDDNIFYSFLNKGFVIEEITRYIKPDRVPFPCRLFEIEVTQEEYDYIKAIILTFKSKKKVLKYSKMGVFLGLCGIPYKKCDHYFCSQFVAEVLEESKIVSLKKSSAKFFPKDFNTINEAKVAFQGDHKTMLEFFKIKKAAI